MSRNVGALQRARAAGQAQAAAMQRASERCRLPSSARIVQGWHVSDGSQNGAFAADASPVNLRCVSDESQMTCPRISPQKPPRRGSKARKGLRAWCALPGQVCMCACVSMPGKVNKQHSYSSSTVPHRTRWDQRIRRTQWTAIQLHNGATVRLTQWRRPCGCSAVLVSAQHNVFVCQQL